MKRIVNGPNQKSLLDLLLLSDLGRLNPLRACELAGVPFSKIDDTFLAGKMSERSYELVTEARNNLKGFARGAFNLRVETEKRDADPAGHTIEQRYQSIMTMEKFLKTALPALECAMILAPSDDLRVGIEAVKDALIACPETEIPV
jgi:hypothetical protein